MNNILTDLLGNCIYQKSFGITNLHMLISIMFSPLNSLQNFRMYDKFNVIDISALMNNLMNNFKNMLKCFT